MSRLEFGMILALLALLTVSAAADDYNKFYLSPEDSSCDLGEDVIVWVMVNTSYNDINAAQASIIYDPNVVSLALAEKGVPNWYMWGYHIYDYSTDLMYLMIGASDVMGTFGPGELQLAKLTLHGEAIDVSALHFGNGSEVGLSHLTQISGQGGIYPHTTTDGTFTCEAPAPNVAVTINNASFGTMLAGNRQELNVSLTLNNTGTVDANITAVFKTNVSGTYGLNGTDENIIPGTNFELGLYGHEIALENTTGTTVISTIPAGVEVTYDAILTVPAGQAADDYSGIVELIIEESS